MATPCKTPIPLPDPTFFIKQQQGSCPEDSLDAATLAGGYKWVPDALRITEANEPLLSLTCHNAAYWEKHNADALRQVWCCDMMCVWAGDVALVLTFFQPAQAAGCASWCVGSWSRKRPSTTARTVC